MASPLPRHVRRHAREISRVRRRPHDGDDVTVHRRHVDVRRRHHAAAVLQPVGFGSGASLGRPALQFKLLADFGFHVVRLALKLAPQVLKKYIFNNYFSLSLKNLRNINRN